MWLSGQMPIFGVVFFVSKYPLDIERQKQLRKFAFWYETLKAKLEYWYTEHDLFPSAKLKIFLSLTVLSASALANISHFAPDYSWNHQNLQPTFFL